MNEYTLDTGFGETLNEAVEFTDNIQQLYHNLIDRHIDSHDKTELKIKLVKYCVQRRMDIYDALSRFELKVGRKKDGIHGEDTLIDGKILVKKLKENGWDDLNYVLIALYRWNDTTKKLVQLDSEKFKNENTYMISMNNTKTVYETIHQLCFIFTDIEFVTQTIKQL